MKTNIKLLPLLLVLALLQACGSKIEKTASVKGNDPVPVTVMTLKKELRDQPVMASGQFTTDDETFLSFKAGGVISNILVKEGESIHKGQLLATLDLTDINALVEQASLAYQKALRDYERAKNLQKDSVATLEQLQNAKTGLDVATQQLNSAKFNLKYSEIRAVNDGYILKKFANTGQVMSSGSPVFQTNGAADKNWILKVGVSDKQWSQIKLNDKASIYTDALSGTELSAVVSSKSEGADPLTGSFNIELKIINGKQLRLAAGLFGKATIYPSQKAEVWAVPYDAMLDANANKGFVFVTDDGKTARRISVSIASIGKNEVLISNGLENVNQIIVAGSAYLSDKASITINK